MTMQLAERKKLIGFISEIEASRERGKGEVRHQSEIFKKAKVDGFDNKAMRKVLQRRAMSQTDREKMDEAVDAYEHALGALALAKEAVAAGVSAREAAERYHVPRAALGVIVRGSQNAISEPAHNDDGVITEPAASPPNESCGLCPVPPGSVAPDNDGNGLRTKGEAEPLASTLRGHSLASCDGVLAGASATTQREDRASPGPQEPDIDIDAENIAIQERINAARRRLQEKVSA